MDVLTGFIVVGVAITERRRDRLNVGASAFTKTAAALTGELPRVFLSHSGRIRGSRVRVESDDEHSILLARP